MSGLLKSGSAAAGTRVRPVALQAAAPEPAPAPRPDPELERLRGALADANEAVAERDAVVASIDARLDEALAKGEAQGRAAAERKETERLAAIEAAAAAALARFAEALAGLERLAALLAATCLDRMLLADDGRAATVEALLKAQLSRLEAGAALTIQVSAADFPDPDALDALAPPGCRIAASASLKPGDCTVGLRLGTLEVGIGQQWGALRAALEEMAQ